MRGVVAGSHRGIRRTGLAMAIAIALILLHVFTLAMMKRAVNRIAAGSGIGSRERIGKRRSARCQQRKERCYRQKLSRNVPQFHECYRECTTQQSSGTAGFIRSRITQKSAACVLTGKAVPANIHGMAYSFLIFDFGGDEDSAQQARHRIEGWKQGFRLDKKLQLKIERKELEEKSDIGTETSSKTSKPGSKAKSTSKTKVKSARAAESEAGSNSSAASDIRMIVRLDFSDHEKLSHQRWLERIPTEEPFKTANPKVIRPGGPDFATTDELFESLD
jgi:hypothetical protein